MPFSHLPAVLSAWLSQIVGVLDRRSAPRLLLLLLGALFARGRRTVTTWFRAAGVGEAFRPAYNALWAAGRRASALACRLLCVALLPLMRLAPGGHLLFAIDDTPTPRYGPCVQGAGIHHNPSPGPAGEKFVYGHLWVALAWLVRHPLWDTLSLPLRALLYVRAKDVPELAKAYPWDFRTKLELAVELVGWLKAWLSHVGKALWVVADGGYAKRPFLRPVLALGLVVFSRLRKDANLASLPTTTRRPGQRGPLPTYGKDQIDLAKLRRPETRLAAGGVRAVRGAGGQDDQDVRGDLAAGRRSHPRGDRARDGRLAGLLLHRPHDGGGDSPGGDG